MASRTRRALSRFLSGVAAAAVTASTVALAAPAAHADIHDRIASAKQQLQHLQTSAEEASEKLNGARIELADAQRKAQSAKHDLAQAQDQVATLSKQVASFAAAAYTGQTMSGLQLVASGSPEHWLDTMRTMDVVAREQAATMVKLKSAHRHQRQAKAAAQRAVAAKKHIVGQLKDTRSELVANAHQQKKLVDQLIKKQQRIIAQAKAARAKARREAAQRREAKLEAKRHAIAQAQQRARQMSISAAPQRESNLVSTSSTSSSSSSHTASSSSTSPPAQSSAPAPAPAPAPAGNAASVAVSWAHRELGKPYVWGAGGPNAFDCSGLTQYVYGKAGVSLPHYTGAQYNSGPHVSRGQLQPGDLVFFGSDLHHVGIYIGGGSMIEAPHTGANVRVAPAFRSNYVGAVRPTG